MLLFLCVKDFFCYLSAMRSVLHYYYFTTNNNNTIIIIMNLCRRGLLGFTVYVLRVSLTLNPL